ncbi:type I restriction enzyme, S subunit [Kandleria vitulina]|uniref:restriction endonuclease subunit S n=1 Tax=Kandleria vitulina TaxID=1630 RepID=UPI000880EBD2|nr:restriction endonuclease subunit S [Kandleria vitulina]SDL32769.1 type I restriction enzyme, S subunit [Kandleria vitulina]
MEGWRKVRLGDVCKTNTDSYSPKEKWDYVNYLDTGNITNNRIDSIQYIDIKNDKLPSRARRKVKTNSIVYSTVRPNQRHFGIIKDHPENFLVSTGFTVIDTDEAVLNANYLYYLLSQPTLVESLHAIAEQSTSAYPSIKASDIEDLELEIPDITIQEKIVDILGCLDVKITNNIEINDNLLQQARALYQAWFVDYAPFNGVRPSDWIDDTIDGLAKEVICGKTPSTKVSEYYGNDVPFITIPDMHGNTYAVTTERYLSSYGAQSQPKKTLPRNSICVSCIGTAGLVTLTAQESQTNQQINSIIPKEGYSSYYIYLLMETLSVIINNLGQSGSTIVNLNKAQFGKIAVVIPSIEIMKSFDEIVSPMFESILLNQEENIKLAELRDSLLPRLMSGEFDISDIDI